MLSSKLSKELSSILETKINTFLKKNKKAILGTTPALAAGRGTKRRSTKGGKKPAAAATA
jgi:hypothetical protein